MKKVKNSIKVLTILVIMIIISNLFAIKANATEVSDDYVQNILNLIPDNMNLDIKESEYEQAENIVLEKTKTILKSNNIDLSNIDIVCEIRYWGYSNNLDEFYKCHILIRNGNQIIGEKDIAITYSNHKEWNSKDSSIISKINLNESPKYYEVDYDNYEDDKYSVFKMMEKYFQSKVDGKSIKMDFGTHNGDSTGAAVSVLVFKNDVLYRAEYLGLKYTVPVIEVPNSEDDIFEYAKSKLNSEDSTIAKIEKSDINLDDCYKVYYRYGNPSHLSSGVDIVIRKKAGIESISKTDANTKIKLDTNTSVVPLNTVLVVKEITAGEMHDIVENILKDIASKMYVFDITLKSNNAEIQPSGNVKISIPIPENVDSSKVSIYRVDENRTRMEYKPIIEDNYAIFETDHFSTYVLAERSSIDSKQENNELVSNNSIETTNEHILDLEPKTGTSGFIISVLVALPLFVTGFIICKKKMYK